MSATTPTVTTIIKKQMKKIKIDKHREMSSFPLLACCITIFLAILLILALVTFFQVQLPPENASSPQVEGTHSFLPEKLIYSPPLVNIDPPVFTDAQIYVSIYTHISTPPRQHTDTVLWQFVPVKGEEEEEEKEAEEEEGENSDASLKWQQQEPPQEQEPTAPRYGSILITTIKKSSDTITVRIYDAAESGFNRADAFAYLADIYEAILASPLAPDALAHLQLPAILAQAYTEGGAGKRGVYRSTNNCFGVRAGPAHKGPVYARDRARVYASYSAARAAGATDLFRAYTSIQESVDDYISLILTSPLYKKALDTPTPKKYLQRLTAAGYGNPDMVSTWVYIIKLFNLTHPEKLAQTQKES